jgi:hypothetical protein
MARLTDVADRGSKTVFVTPGLDWVAGDVVGFAATSIQYNHSETAVVSSYNSITGELNLESPLKFYHFGAAQVSSEHQGLDMRGEVVLLTRNIVIQGDSSVNWAGMLLTTDVIKINSAGEETAYSGVTKLDYVELKNMGQENNDKAGIQFTNSMRPSTSSDLSTFTGVTVHNSQGLGIRILNS